jgi:hypothetical protein
VWTDRALFLGTYVGALDQPWRFDEVGRNCGLVGPNAAVVVGQVAFWTSPDQQFFSYALGGAPKPIPCPILEDFADNLAPVQGDKIVASSNSKFSEVRWDYPDERDGYENSRYLRVVIDGPDAGAWSNGELARTAFVDAGPQPYPVATTYEGNIYYHDKGSTGDGQALTSSLRTATQAFDPNSRLLIKGCWPDFKDQIGPVTITVYARETPQSDEISTSSATLSPGDARADLWVSGAFFEVEITASSLPSKWRGGKLTFDVERAGRTR